MAAPGVVYTRDWVVEFVLDLAGYTSGQDLLSGLVMEPSCGNGAFLKHIIQRLCECAKRKGMLRVDKLAPCIRAYDLDATSVASSRSVAEEVLKRNGLSAAESHRLAHAWISKADFLLADVPRAKWVVGNPPYVRANMIPRAQRALYKVVLSCTTMGTDLYVGFFEKGLSALEDNGTLCFICADRWLQNRYGSRLRSYVAESYSLDAHVRMHGVDAFENVVSAYPAITLIRKGAGSPIRYVECDERFSARNVPEVEAWLMGDEDEYRSDNATGGILGPLTGSAPVPLASPQRLDLLAGMTRRFPLIEDAGVKLGIGVASGCDEVYVTEDPNLVESDRMLPLFFMRDWRAGNHNRKKCLVNPWNDDGTLVNLDDYPKLRNYLQKNEARLKARRVAKDHPNDWYRTLDKPDHSLLGEEMLLFPDMASRSDPVYSDGSRYPHHNCYWMTSSEWDIRALGGLMMSDIVEGYVDAFGIKMRGSTLRFQAQYLRMVHIPRASEVDDQTKSALVEAFIDGNREQANKASRKAYGLEDVDA